MGESRQLRALTVLAEMEFYLNEYGAVAPMVEQYTEDVRVSRSNRLGTTNGRMTEPGNVPAWKAEAIVNSIRSFKYFFYRMNKEGATTGVQTGLEPLGAG